MKVKWSIEIPCFKTIWHLTGFVEFIFMNYCTNDTEIKEPMCKYVF